MDGFAKAFILAFLVVLLAGSVIAAIFVFIVAWWMFDDLENEIERIKRWMWFRGRRHPWE